MLITNVNAEDASVPTPPSTEDISKAQPEYSIKTETVYESSFLPGVRLCEESEVDYRGEFRKVNCQDETLINAVSTRKQDPYNARPHIIVDDRIEPNGNIFRINFRKKASVVPNTSDN
ncbi:MAG: hypothetical protein R8G33_00875 [Gammaproteobacteria bacterium]|nr:hypothetical protein [Gammaproteobacteria bacterium]